MMIILLPFFVDDTDGIQANKEVVDPLSEAGTLLIEMVNGPNEIRDEEAMGLSIDDVASTGPLSEWGEDDLRVIHETSPRGDDDIGFNDCEASNRVCGIREESIEYHDVSVSNVNGIPCDDNNVVVSINDQAAPEASPTVVVLPFDAATSNYVYDESKAFTPYVIFI